MKISEILWKAANEHLRQPGNGRFFRPSPGKKLSCCAVVAAMGPEYMRLDWSVAKQLPAVQFLKELGVRVGSLSEFDRFGPDEQQEVRYAWLMFAAMVAEEEGL